jgi:hypothetical protein
MVQDHHKLVVLQVVVEVGGPCCRTTGGKGGLGSYGLNDPFLVVSNNQVMADVPTDQSPINKIFFRWWQEDMEIQLLQDQLHQRVVVEERKSKWH